MTTVTIDDGLMEYFRAVVGPEEDVNAFTSEALRALLAQRARDSARWQAARTEAQAILSGPRHTLEEVNARVREKYNFPDLSHMTREELADDAERIIAAMDPDVRAAMEREGLL
jgi:hypothetical protein